VSEPDGGEITEGTVVIDEDSGDQGIVRWISSDDPEDIIAKVEFSGGEVDYVNLEDLSVAADQGWRP
jgi:hypothetical protein